MLKEIKILIMIVLLILLSIFDGLLILKSFENNSSIFSVEQKKDKEILEKLQTINIALNHLSQKDIIPNASFSATPNPKSFLSTQDLKNLNLTAKIYNASSVSSLAATFKEKLSTLNIYQEILTGNLEATSSSTLKFKGRVLENIREQTRSLINKSNSLIEIPAEDNESSDFILILGSDFKLPN